MICAPGAAQEPPPEDERRILTLEGAIESAVSTHPSIASVEASVAAAGTLPAQVAAWSDPKIAVGGAIPFGSPSDPPRIGISLSQKFPLSPVYAHKAEAAGAQAEALATEIPERELDVALAVSSVYWRVVFLEELRDVLERQLELAESVVEAATLRSGVSQGKQADVIRAAIFRDELETEIEVLDIEIRAARELLVLLVGGDLDPGAFYVESPGYPAVTSDAGALATLAAGMRPSLEAYAAQSEAIDAQHAAAKAALAPWLVLEAGYVYNSDTMPGVMGEDAFSFGVGLTVPIAGAKAAKAGMDEAEALAVENASAEEAALLSLTGDIITLVARIDGIEARIAFQDEDVLPKATMAFDLTLADYAAQSASITDVLSALDRLLRAERDRTLLMMDYFEAVALLRRTVGSFEAPL